MKIRFFLNNKNTMDFERAMFIRMRNERIRNDRGDTASELSDAETIMYEFEEFQELDF